jgi:hypothetical protein
MVLNPVSPEELRKALGTGIQSFAFRKVNGDLRLAVGTTKLALIPASQHPTGKGATKSSVAFYDTEKKEWRSVSESQQMYLPE